MENIFANVTPGTNLYIRTSTRNYTLVTVKSVSRGGRITTINAMGYEQKWNSEGEEIGDKDRFNHNLLLPNNEETTKEIQLAKEKQEKNKNITFLRNFDYAKLDAATIKQIKELLENNEK